MSRRTAPLTWTDVRKIGLALPQAEESTSYGTPALKVKGKLFARLREEGDIIIVRIEPDERAMRIAADPDAFLVSNHYEAHPYMLVRLPSVAKSDLKELLDEAWRIVAP